MMDEAIFEMHVLASRAVELLVRHLDAGMVVFVDGSRQKLSETEFMSELTSPHSLLHCNAERQQLRFRSGSGDDARQLRLPAEGCTIDEQDIEHAALATELVVGPRAVGKANDGEGRIRHADILRTPAQSTRTVLLQVLQDILGSGQMCFAGLGHEPSKLMHRLTEFWSSVDTDIEHLTSQASVASDEQFVRAFRNRKTIDVELGRKR